MKQFLNALLPVVTGLAFVFALYSCGENNSVKTESEDDPTLEVRKLEKEVIDVHDEVMPKLAELNNTRKKLIDKLYSPDSVGNSLVINETIDRLEEADSLMWDWMHNYSRPDYSTNLDSIRNYLDAELVKVRVMRDKFWSSFNDGNKLLDELESDHE